MAANYKDITYTDEAIKEMRNWAKDCQWNEDENDSSFIDDLSDVSILIGVERNYDGGLSEFMKVLNEDLLINLS